MDTMEVAQGRRILIIDISGVLNDSQSAYNCYTYDSEAVHQLMRIVRKTGCDVWVSPTINDYKSYEAMGMCSAISNLLGAVMTTDVKTCIGIENVVEWLGRSKPESFCVLRYHDSASKEWLATFGNRYVHCGYEVEETDKDGKSTHRNLFKSGLTKDIADSVIAMLGMKVESKDIPIKVGAYDSNVPSVSRIKSLAEHIRNDPNQRNTQALKMAYEKYINGEEGRYGALFSLLNNTYRVKGGERYEWAIEAMKEVSKEKGLPFDLDKINALLFD